MSNLRFKALESIGERKAIEPKKHHDKISDIFGANVFSLDVMKEYLEADIYEEMRSHTQHGETLGRNIADKVAYAMKTWASERGVSHYTHWFQPLTGLTAEKHDAFFELENGKPIDKFSGDKLAQAEPDASSFPSGGIRNTFEARGYTAWDPTSPAFIFENKYGKTLCIPTIFVSYTGEALDYKAPLLKAVAAVEKAAVDVCQMFDKSITRVTPTLGAEQEYFLVDSALYNLRPDLLLTGRTLLGAPPARGQQLEDHYFGSIAERVFAFMKDFETESYKLGIPVVTRHNEVAPGQFECAPFYEDLNIAIDHNQLLMDLMDRVARAHNFRVLLHEKPFAGVNGSGKHNNWSLGTNTGKNLLSPGKNPKENLMFLTFFVNSIKAVHEHADLLRASIASAANDHRLGANEAPPAIISAFIGHHLEQILDDIVKPTRKKADDTPKAYIKMGIKKLPEILLDNTDRNRTSPFAFTGNKFEFRAVGSSANCAAPMTVLNSIMAKQLTEFKKAVDKKVARGKKKEAAILDVIRQYIIDTKAIRFHGNGYSQEWVEEAARRGLSNIKTTPRALDAYKSEKTKELFTSLGIFTEKELDARHEIRLEMYIKKVEIEAHVLGDLSRNHILPAGLRYLNEVVNSISALKSVGIKENEMTAQLDIVREINSHVNEIKRLIDKLAKLRDQAAKVNEMREMAIQYSDKVIPAMAELREHADRLELLVADDLWPLPKYRELMFIR